MKNERVNYDNWHFTAKREHGGLVPYGSTFVNLPDEWDMDWKGTIKVDLSGEDRADWLEGDWRDVVQEMLDDEPYDLSSCERVFVKDWKLLKNDGWLLTIEAEDVEIK